MEHHRYARGDFIEEFSSMSSHRILRFPALAGLSACGGDSDDRGEPTPAVTDAPVDSAAAVVVEFTGVELHGPAGTQQITFDAPKRIDLLTLTGNASENILDATTLPAGEYQWLRLTVNAQRQVIDSYIDLENGARHSLYIPSGAQTGLQLHTGFVIPVGGHADFTIDFDLRKSVHAPENAADDYVLRPSLRIVSNVEVGSIAGGVAGALVTAECTPVIYLFSGHDVVPDDEDGSEPSPLTSAIPQLDAQSGEFAYEIGFVEEGDYTITFNCDGANDDPLRDDVLEFAGTRNISVVADETARADFE